MITQELVEAVLEEREREAVKLLRLSELVSDEGRSSRRPALATLVARVVRWRSRVGGRRVVDPQPSRSSL